MSFSKNIVAGYHFLESTDGEYFDKLSKTFNDILQSSNHSGSFDTTDTHYLWKLNEKINLASEDAFIVSLASERISLPVWFNDDGVISEIPKNNGMIGELFYACIAPKKRFMISLSATSGSATSAFKNFLNEFSLDMGVKAAPLFENDINERVMNFGFYKRLALSLNFPLHDDLAEFLATEVGNDFSILDKVGGLKIDIVLSNSKPKHTLEAYQTRELITELVDNELCGKLKVSGGGFDDEAVEHIDIKNAVIKYKEKVVINGSYLTLGDAISVMLRAYNERAKELTSS